MRQGLPALLFALAPCLVMTSTYAQAPTSNVLSIESELFTKHSELEAAQKLVADKSNQVSNQQELVNRLIEQNNQYSSILAKAKQNLERDYAKMIDEPELDLEPTQSAYQEAWSKVKRNQSEQLTAAQDKQALELELAQLKAEQAVIEQSIAQLDNEQLRSRADRLKSELHQSGKQKVSFTNTCQSNMTLAQCSGQTTDLALQKAVKQFQNELVESTSEPALVKQNIASASLSIHVLRHNVVNASFYGDNKHKTVVDVELEARPATNAPCKLLNIDSQYCFAPGEESTKAPEKEVAWVSLSIRSNQYNDSVSVNGVKYGSTPLEVMLPVGPHMITIEKEGYRSFNQELRIKSDHTLRAVLREKENVLKTGHKFADAIGSNAKAPEMVVIEPGQFLLGEHGEKQYNLDHAFAIASTPITVMQFETFIKRTNYQTDAELQNICTAVAQSEVTPISDSYWRNPGFKQSASSPAVCISRNDATAYTHWLSQETGFTYRLPSSDEWEVAARAGSKSNFWWGDNFDEGQANTGWSGTPWSNVSTSPVKSFPANRYGLYDVVGNVWEWTQDSKGVAKGGAWSFSPNEAQAQSELYLAPTMAANYVGFRVLRQL